MNMSLPSTLQALVDLWHASRESGMAIPERSRFDPMSLGKLLPHVHLLEFHGRDALVYRLSGTAELRRLGSDTKGEDYFDLTDAAAGAYLRRNMHTIAFHPAGVVVETRETHADGREVPTVFIALPLRSVAEERDFIVAIVEIQDDGQNRGRPPFFDQQRAPWSDRVVAVYPYDLGFGLPPVSPYTAAAT